MQLVIGIFIGGTLGFVFCGLFSKGRIDEIYGSKAEVVAQNKKLVKENRDLRGRISLLGMK